MLVRAKGLEPPHLSILEPKSSASTSSATPAGPPVGGVYSSRRHEGKHRLRRAPQRAIDPIRKAHYARNTLLGGDFIHAFQVVAGGGRRRSRFRRPRHRPI